MTIIINTVYKCCYKVFRSILWGSALFDLFCPSMARSGRPGAICFSFRRGACVTAVSGFAQGPHLLPALRVMWSEMQDSNLLSHKRQIYSLVCLSCCTDFRYIRAVGSARLCSFIRASTSWHLRGVAAVIPPIVTGSAALFYVIRPPCGSVITFAPSPGLLMKGGEK